MRDQRTEGSGVSAECFGAEPLQASRGQLLADHERCESDCGRDAEASSLDHGRGIGGSDSMALRFDDAVSMRPPRPHGNAEADDGRPCRDCRDEGGVKARPQAEPALQELLPARRRPAREPGEGHDSTGGTCCRCRK